MITDNTRILPISKHHIAIPDFMVQDIIDVLKFYTYEKDDGFKAKQLLYGLGLYLNHG